MTSDSDMLLINHEIESAGKPWILVREHYYQEGFAGFPGIQMYKVLTGDFEKSDKTMAGILKLGYRVEIVP